MNEKAITINYLASTLHLSDKKISEIFDVTRSSISHYRKKHGINRPITNGRRGELAAISRLKKLGFDVKDMNDIDKKAPFDILVDDRIRVEVKTSQVNYQESDVGRCIFALANGKHCNSKVSEHRFEIFNGATVKDYEHYADYFVFVGIDYDEVYFWVIPTNKINYRVRTYSFYLNKNEKYRDNFDLLKEPMEV
ncbi:hypothetical protein [Staphylococcus pasteuri]|uniref:hypothetical protein n=1 Tax=Staphylococcus pasteuri TaxID=45972 RepID=UPI0003C08948|nr:hypothetical protein [Staphylococcus pasteuri]AGZ24986.1 hypothetical protein STP1_0675 [Staphylococcus pasteuri SP1]